MHTIAIHSHKRQLLELLTVIITFFRLFFSCFVLIILKSDDQPKPSGRVHIHRLRGLHFQVSPKDVSGCRNSKDDNSSGSNFFLLLSINQSFIFYFLFSTSFWCSRSRHLPITPRGIRYVCMEMFSPPGTRT